MVIKFLQIDLRAVIHHQARTPDLYFRARRRLGPIGLSGGDRKVERRRLPFGLIGRVKRYRAGHARQPTDAAGRVDGGLLGLRHSR